MWSHTGREPRDRKARNGHRHDQDHARAAAGAGELFDRIAGTFTGRTDTGNPGPILTRLWDEQCRAIHTRALTCVHLLTARPVPAVSAAWRPGWAVCHTCAPALALPLEDPRGRQCDGCLRTAPTAPAALQNGPILFIATLCAECTVTDVMGAKG